MLNFAISKLSARSLRALEKNNRAISFYERHGVCITTDKKMEDDTAEYFVKMER